MDQLNLLLLMNKKIAPETATGIFCHRWILFVLSQIGSYIFNLDFDQRGIICGYVT